MMWTNCFLCSVPSVKSGDVLTSPFSEYTVLETLGCGVFGQVAKCQNMTTNNMAAVKILRRAQTTAEAQEEVPYVVVAHCYVRLIGGGGVRLCCNVFSLSAGQNVKEGQLSQSPQPLTFLWEIPIPGSPMSGLWAALQGSQPDYHRQWSGNAAHWNSTNCKAGTYYRKWTSFSFVLKTCSDWNSVSKVIWS